MRSILSVCTSLLLAGAVPAADVPGLKYVPADAAVFVHVDAGQVTEWKLTQSLLASGLLRDSALAYIPKYTGRELTDLTAVTLCWPIINKPLDTDRLLMVLRWKSPMDIPAIVKRMPKDARYDEKSGIITTPNNMVTIDTSTPSQLTILYGLDAKYLKPAAGGEGTLSPAIQAAGNGAALTIGVNMSKLPDEIRGDDLPPEVAPYKAIFRAERITLQGTFQPSAKNASELRFSLNVDASNAAAAGDVEKAMESARKMITQFIEGGKKELARDKERSELMLPIMQRVEKMFTQAKVESKDRTTTAKMSLDVDLNLDSFVRNMQIQSDRFQIVNNHKQIALALHNYESAFQQFPKNASVDKQGKPLLSWRVEILPYIGEEPLYKKFKHDEPWDSEHNMKVLKENPMPYAYAIQGTKNAEDKTTHYQLWVGPGAVFEAGRATKIQQITDGTSNTIMLATASKAVPWTKPEDLEFDPKKDPRKLLLFSNGGTIVCFSDGSVRVLKESIAEEVLKAMITRAGGETIPQE